MELPFPSNLTLVENKIHIEFYDPELYYLFNDIYYFFQIQEYEKAINLCNETLPKISKDEDLFQFLLLRGTALLFQNEYQKALADYEKAIQINPKNPVAHLDKGRCLLKLDELDLALASTRTSIELNPQLGDSYANLGNIYEKKEMHDLAIENYSLAIKYFTNNNEKSDAFFRRAKCQMKSRNFMQAIDDFTDAISLEPNDENLLIYLQNRALAYYTIKQYQDALCDIEKLIEAEPKSTTFRLLRVEVLMRQQRKTDLQKFLKEIVSTTENREEAADMIRKLANASIEIGNNEISDILFETSSSLSKEQKSDFPASK
ncbi:MAG: tetratricopeptide repeat protein [Anaerolineaceae bacterium]|nr:tetratricopeptide repeat protein [Anaerolineaceae bacterium]